VVVVVVGDEGEGGGEKGMVESPPFACFFPSSLSLSILCVFLLCF